MSVEMPSPVIPAGGPVVGGDGPGPNWFTKLWWKVRFPVAGARQWGLWGGIGLGVVVIGVGGFLWWRQQSAGPLTIATEKTSDGLRVDTDGDGQPDATIPATETPTEQPATSTPAPSQSGSGGSASTGSGTSGGSGGSSGGSTGGSTASCALPKYPTAACTGVPAGWTPTTTINGNLVVNTAGAVIENYLVTGTIDVRAANVTIRKTRVYGKIDNFMTSVVYGPLLIEDSEVVLPPGQSSSDNYESAIGVSNYTCRRCKVTGRVEGWRVGATGYTGAGPVTIEDSYAKLQVTQAQCDADDPHGDGIQGYGGTFATIRHNTIDQRDDPCPTAPIFIPDQGNAGGNITDNVVAGGGFSLRLTGGSFPNVTGNKVVNNTWGYGPLDVACNLIGTWSGNATITFDWSTGTILSQVQVLNEC